MEKVKSSLQTHLELLRIMPDLSLRVTFIIVALGLMVIAFAIGEVHGRNAAAESQLAVTGALPYESWAPAALNKGASSVGAQDVSLGVRNFVASANGKLYYPLNCKSAARIKEENRIYFATVAEAKSNGLTAAKSCP